MTKSRKASIANIDTVHQGDSVVALADESLIPNETVDLIITSPPYADKRKKYYDGVHPDKYVEWFEPIGLQLYRVLKPKGSFVLNIKEHARDGERDTYVLELILELKKQGWRWVEEYVWYKKNSFPGKWPNRFRDAWERCLHFTKEKQFNMYQDQVKVPIGNWAEKRFKSMGENDFVRHVSKTNKSLGRNVSNWLDRKEVYPHNVVVLEEEHYLDNHNVLEFATECSNTGHSAAFPIELPSWFINLFTVEGDLVLDPFMGSGTTAYAAALLGRHYQGIEKEQKYVDLFHRNIEALQTTKYSGVNQMMNDFE